MSLKSSQSILRAALTFAALSALTAGCGRTQMSDEEVLTGEAAAALTVSEEASDVGADGIALAPEGELDGAAAEAADEPVDNVPQGVGNVCNFGERRKQVLADYDADGDGKLNEVERKALRDDLGKVGERPKFARLGWRFRHYGFRVVRWAFDENGDRELSAEERAAMVDALEARCERIKTRLLNKFDTDKDGKLSESERQAIRDDVRAALRKKFQDLLAKYDANHSGVLEPRERLQIREDILKQLRARRAELVAKYDTNQDGKLSVEEALALRQAIQKRIIEGAED